MVLNKLMVWPTVNAMLNATSAVLLLRGVGFIRARNRAAHARCMISACVASSAFLLSYLAYHAHVGSVRFGGVGAVRPIYFTVLLSHTTLAMVIVPLVISTLWLALRRRFEFHKRLARWTFPLWVYVSISGVAVYLMLYQGK